ncbi:MAG: hypothetical protein ACLSTI_01405 [Ruminococcus sp.]
MIFVAEWTDGGYAIRLPENGLTADELERWFHKSIDTERGEQIEN